MLAWNSLQTHGNPPASVFVPLGENTISTTTVEPNLKKALLNTGQDNGHWPDPYPEFPENGSKLHLSEAYKGKPHKTVYF